MKTEIYYCDCCGLKTVPPFEASVDLKYTLGGNHRAVYNKKEICLVCSTKIFDFIQTLIPKPHE